MRISIQRAPAAGAKISAFLFLSTLLAAFTAHANVAPKIYGTPATTVKVSSWYSFLPTASDPDDALKTLRFSIANKPQWATFSVYSGRLSGSPTVAGSWSNIRISVSDGEARAYLPAFGITAGTTSTGAPRISGTPATSVRSGTAYSFTPTASDPNGDTLTFSIANRPAWGTFSTSTGRLSGTPTSSQIGTYSNIKISVSDGRSSASLPVFAIAVTDVVNGAATVSWLPPTRNSDGSTLTNLAGYRIYYGTSSGALTRTVQIANAGTARYVIDNLSPATWYFAVRAYNSSGGESAASNVASKTIR
jgi:hypothetical protein